MKTFALEVLDSKQVLALGADLSVHNEDMTETAGFIPLEVKFKQFEQNGIINQLRSEDFTSSDYREMYLHPDFDINPEDDIEDVQEKLESLKNYRQNLMEKIKEENSKKVLKTEETVQNMSDEQKENKK